MRLLFIGDVIGEPGRQTLASLLPHLKSERTIDFVIANGENSAGGIGVTKDTARNMFHTGVDVITLGNHVWAKKEVYPYLDEDTRVIRPANYPQGVPGRGWGIFSTALGGSVGVVNLCGRVFMDNLENPFRKIDEILETMSRKTNTIVVDFHAEATSEKAALGWYLNGRVSAVLGTHTHVQTADERILPGGTAYISDAGMTGPLNSVIGVRTELILSRFLTHMPNKFEVAGGEMILSAVQIDIDSATGKAVNIERLMMRHPGCR